MQTESQISRIKHLLNNKSLSFIIGAGFSSNMSDKFVNWRGLLQPMIKEMYHLENEDDIKNKIDEIGYLDIAQEYVRRKGYHEAIDIYIEQHTPIVYRVENPKNLEEPQYIVKLNGVSEEADITCHKLLFELDVKHIFTFNYDNCLDIIGNTGLDRKLLEEIRRLQNELEFLEQQKKKIKEFSNISTKANTIRELDKLVSASPSNTDGGYITFIRELYTKYPNIGLIVGDSSAIEANYNVLEKEIGKIKAQILSLKKRQKTIYQLITASGDLSLTDGRRNIYKLHGSIRLDNTTPYGFDGDSHCNYIITTDDYQFYPTKHEPFVDYMKISLLKGAFCIIGFSCDDPNFLSWMSWVKEVIEKNPEIKKELSQDASSRFFYINSDDVSLSEDKVLLLKNHYIECVDLFQIFSETGHKSKLERFFKRLLPSSVYFPKIRRAWNKVNNHISGSHYPEREWNISLITPEIEFLYNCRNINRLPIQVGSEHNDRDHVLRILHQKFRHKWNEASDTELKLVFSALKEELLLPSHYFEGEEFNLLLHRIDRELLPELIYLQQKDIILNGQSLSKYNFGENVFMRIWSHLYKFDFSGAKSILDTWNPQIEEPIECLRKLMFQMLFSEDVFEEILPLSNRDLYSSDQDYVNALKLLSLLSIRFQDVEYQGMLNIIDFSNEINQLETGCVYLKNANHIIDKLLEAIKGYEKPTPFGNKSNSFTFGGGNPRFVNSFKTLSILFELCHPLHIANIILFNEEKWGIVCDNLIEYYPYPCLFYSLQYDSKNLTKSVSQKILYSDKLRAELPEIVKSLFIALRQPECPDFYRRSIMNSLPILLKGVDSSVWNDDFITSFEKLQPYNPTSRRFDDLNYGHEDFYELISFGLKYTSNKYFKLTVISDLLNLRECIGNWENSLIINAMYSLTDDDFNKSEFIDAINQSLLWLCRNGNKPAHIYVILNLIKLLEKEAVEKSLVNLSDELIASDCTLLKAIPKYIGEDSSLIPRLKKLVINSKFLWYNGISKNSVALGTSFLDIADISTILKFSIEELSIIWKKMKISFEQILSCDSKRHGEDYNFFMSHFTILLDEMKRFIENNDFPFLSMDEVDQVLQHIISLRISISSNDSESIHELLVNDEANEAISMLVDIKPENLFPKYQSEYVLIATKLILMKSKHLNSCIKHFSWVIETYENSLSQDIFKPLLECILIAYESYFKGSLSWDITFAKKEDMETGLVKIYSVYKKWGGHNEFWNNYSPRFINN